jgi:hypothetical protein
VLSDLILLPIMLAGRATRVLTKPVKLIMVIRGKYRSPLGLPLDIKDNSASQLKGRHTTLSF